MDHPAECLGGLDAMRRLRTRARAQRIPISASIALTHRCNLRCAHCYARGDSDGGQERTTGFWLGLLDQLADAGCLFLLITGGEPLARPDFAEIYRHARDRGMIVSVFTNGTLVNDAVVALFRDRPPRVVDITLYGLSEETYQRVTGAKGVFERVWAGVQRLAAAGISLGLKTVLMTHTRSELEAMEAAARQLGARFRLDGALFPRFDGDRAPLDLRLPAEDVAAIEFSSASRASSWAAFHRRAGGHRMQAGDPLYICSAGMTHAHIDPAGALHPCVMVRRVAQPLDRVAFPAAWEALGAQMTERRLPQKSPCIDCGKAVLCGYCPGFSELETGAEDRVSEYQCKLGEARLAQLRRAV